MSADEQFESVSEGVAIATVPVAGTVRGHQRVEFSRPDSTGLPTPFALANFHQSHVVSMPRARTTHQLRTQIVAGRPEIIEPIVAAIHHDRRRRRRSLLVRRLLAGLGSLAVVLAAAAAYQKLKPVPPSHVPASVVAQAAQRTLSTPHRASTTVVYRQLLGAPVDGRLTFSSARELADETTSSDSFVELVRMTASGSVTLVNTTNGRDGGALVHYRGRVDVAAAGDRVPALTGTSSLLVGDDGRFDVWIDRSGRITRVTMDVDGARLVGTIDTTVAVPLDRTG